MAEALPEHQAGLRLHRIIAMGRWDQDSGYSYIDQSSVQLNVKLKLHHPNGCQQRAQWYSTAVTVTRFSKEAQSDQFPDEFLSKKPVFRLCHNICWSSKMASDIQNRCRCAIQQLSFEVIQMVLGKSSGMAGQGSGEASCEHTAATGCRGHVHNANTSRQGKHWVSERDSSWPKLQLLWGKNTVLRGLHQRYLQLWWRHRGP